MMARGTVRDGVVVLEEGVSLPEGTTVTVVSAEQKPGGDEKMSEAERQRILGIMNRIAAMPIEGPEEPFSGADHDEVLYGEP